jgi:hypothetical protein
MIRAEFRKELTDQRGVAVILWSCFMIAIPLYIVIVKNVLMNPKYAAGLSFRGSARILLWTLVAVDIGYFLWWKQRYLKPEAILNGVKPAKILRALEGHKGALEERAAAAVSTYVTRKTVVFAIIEALAVYGLVLGLVGPYLPDHYLLSAASLALLTFEFPAERQIESLLLTVESGEIHPRAQSGDRNSAH